MFKKSFPFILTLLLLFTPNISFSQELGGISFGIDNYLISNSDNKYNINPSGISAGLLIPINISFGKIYFKVKACHHTADYYSYQHQHKLEYLFSATNEILIGTLFNISKRVSLIPQIGIGGIGETLFYNVNKGYSHGELFIDLSMIGKYKMHSIDLGIMINLENDILQPSSSMTSNKRLNIALLVLK